MPATTFTLAAPAKLNLFLDVLGVRPDGYHDIHTLFLPLPAVADTLRLELTAAPGLELQCDDPSLPNGAENLVCRAATAFAQAATLTPRWRFLLTKRIPAAAGLGGGSSDAAAALKLLNQAHNYPLPPAALHAVAARLGADVPFFLAGVPAQAEGIGERLSPVPCAAPLPVILLNPGFPIPTPWAYRKVDHTPRPPAPAFPPLLAALAAGDLPALARHTYNAFDYPAQEKFPLLELLLTALREAGCLSAHLCGSGATVFGLAPAAAELPRLAAELRRRFDFPCWLQTALAGAVAP